MGSRYIFEEDQQQTRLTNGLSLGEESMMATNFSKWVSSDAIYWNDKY